MVLATGSIADGVIQDFYVASSEGTGGCSNNLSGNNKERSITTASAVDQQIAQCSGPRTSIAFPLSRNFCGSSTEMIIQELKMSMCFSNAPTNTCLHRNAKC